MSTDTQFTWLRPQYIWLDDELAAAEDAPEVLLASQSSGGAFEELRCYDTRRGPAIFRLQDYVDRFLHTVQAMGVPDLGFDPEKLRAAICSTVQANGYVDCTIRPQVVYLNPLGEEEMDSYQPTIGIAAWRCTGEPGESCALRVRSRSGPEGLALVDVEDGTTFKAEHLLLVREGEIYAAPGATMLGGMTRDTVLTLARDAGYRVIGMPLTPETLAAADEVLVCSASLEVVAVTEVDGKRMESGPVTGHLQQLFAETVHGENSYALRWLDYMDTVTVI